ncbi:MAG: Fe-S cluster assembly sulfur transfer protein SufU [Burkholderiales bacterium]
MADFRKLYDEVIMDHIKNARNYRRLENANCEAEKSNPLCGDVLSVYLTLEGETIADIGFQCSCCGISMASASIMTASVKGKSRSEAQSLFRHFSRLLAQPDAALDDELAVLAVVREFPSRIQCATLAWETLEKALNKV